jgi:hypothetical protein
MTHQVQPGAESRNQLWSWGVLENSGGKRKSFGQTTCHNSHNFDFAGTYVAKEKHADPA